jgi:hypothetical protein
MTYYKCKWNHSFPDEPIMLYAELDDQRWQRRAVELFRDGRMSYADGQKEFGGLFLSPEPVPPLSDIAADPQFEPVEITQLEFESVWREAIAHAPEG